MASHLGKTIGELKSQVTYREFLEWCQYLTQEEERHTKEDHYLAQIAAEVRRTIVKSPRKIKHKDFLFELGKEGKEQHDSKSVWLAALGLNSDN